MQSETSRQRAQTCLRLALGAGDPQIMRQLIAAAADWIIDEPGEDHRVVAPPIVPSASGPGHRRG
jgi:hypothetical protein